MLDVWETMFGIPVEIRTDTRFIATHREFDEWMKITNALERNGPLRVVMSALARSGARAGIGLREEGGQLRFEHHAALTVAVKS